MRKVVVGAPKKEEETQLKHGLKRLGFGEITTCSDGNAAVALAYDELPDLVILDAELPGLDGSSAAAEIRQRLKIPIILMISSPDAKVVAKAKTSGITTCLVKPLREPDLFPVIELAFANQAEVDRLKEQVADLEESIENRKVIEKAKGRLMETLGLAEADAFRKIQTLAMNKRKSMRQIADAILLTS